MKYDLEDRFVVPDEDSGIASAVARDAAVRHMRIALVGATRGTRIPLTRRSITAGCESVRG